MISPNGFGLLASFGEFLNLRRRQDRKGAPAETTMIPTYRIVGQTGMFAQFQSEESA